VASQTPDFGPSGYLPPRAASRARKIVLREPLGLAWAIGAVVAGVVVLIAGAVLLSRIGPPDAPFVPVGEVAAVDPRGAAVMPVPGDGEALVVRGAGGVTVFTAPDAAVSWCPDTGRLEAADGRVWEPDGRLVGGDGRSLARLPAQVHGGTLYVDPSAAATVRAPRPRGEVPGCVD
jgi:hypothetical protein